MTESPPTLTPTDPPPDWASLERDVFCPLCGYNLRMLTQPRCPECGYRFTWPEVLRQLDLHPYLFEHHPEKNVRSYLRTSLGAWFPRQFWASLRPSQLIYPRRLVAWGLIGVTFLFLSGLSFVLGSVVFSAQYIHASGGAGWYFGSSGTGSTTTALPNSLSGIVGVILSRPGFLASAMNDLMVRIWPLAFLVPLMWLGFTFLALLVFRISMRRARIRPAHMLRCTIYSFDMLAWAMVLTLISAGVPWFLNPNTINMLTPRRVYGRDPLDYLIVSGVVLCAMMSAYRLWKALSLYLRFDHPFATMLATQTIALLASLAILGWCFPWLFQPLFGWWL